MSRGFRNWHIMNKSSGGRVHIGGKSDDTNDMDDMADRNRQDGSETGGQSDLRRVVSFCVMRCERDII